MIQKLKQKLEEERKTLEKELESFAKRDPHLKGDWDSKYPHFDGEAGGAILEKGADEVEEYLSRLPIEFNLELRLRDVNLALEKINRPRQGLPKYGVCEKCGKNIPEKRLMVYPAARFCLKCKRVSGPMD